MKFSTLIVLSGSSFAIATVLEARQRPCAEDNCWSAIWGTWPVPDQTLTAFSDCQKYMTTSVVVYPLTTVFVLETSTLTAMPSCTATPGTSASPGSSLSLSSLPTYVTSTEPAISISFSPGETPSAMPKNAIIEARQAVTSRPSSTVTIYGPMPAYATPVCEGARYASACGCKQIVETVITLISTTMTTSSTLTLTDTTIESCSTIFTITMTHDSSTSMATLTMTSNPDDTSTGTGTGTGSITPTFSSSLPTDPPFTNSTTTALPSLNTTTALPPFTNTTVSSPTFTNTTIATPTSSPPICNGPGVAFCGGIGCVDTKTDTDNCGRCDNKCAPGMYCVNGVCAREPCDSDCSWDRYCSPGNGTLACICASEEQGSGICFDKARYQCSDPSLQKCRTTFGRVGGCPVGSVCVKSICNCSDGPQDDNVGICVSSAGCGETGAQVLGPLVRIGQMEKRRRSFSLEM
ncbi:hypothetical protein P153DRAFT_384659 [Dothidotthia symphoricarpi CBS 119687]|uniref:Uncharacterized protein n=1 Tax=Dothidotthia symphoricarpi CBS 119687 TaxID=1392245 RepID=A0A6A6AEK5_9PLEO|nr:uncharacterized protein P153DRAFT_384659 [Dothidotthia symphoricarpi CBS 119687]KAF2130382.1 hypothetical protein P153DRAFT_384659 [Dothidotthia symphoricarpi CBS 119687]